jgi:excisionase family DNA binding protein
MRSNPTIPLQKRAYSLGEFQAMGGPGRTRFYKLVRTGELHPIKTGRLTKIPAAEVERYFAELPQLVLR